MGTTAITELHMQAVAFLAQGFTEEKAATLLPGVDVRKLLLEVRNEWPEVRSPSTLVIAFAQRLAPGQLSWWQEWATNRWALLRPAHQLQRGLLVALALPSTAGKSLVELADSLGTTEATLSKGFRQLLAALPDVETRAGLTMLCYLIKHAAMPTEPLDDLPDPELSKIHIQVLRQIARGLGNAKIAAKLGYSLWTVKKHVSYLLAAFNAKSRSRLALIYVRRYQTFKERAAWREEVTFVWPRRKAHGQLKLLWLMLALEHCEKKNHELAKELAISEHTVKTRLTQLSKRVQGLPRNRFSMQVAAELHRPS